MMVQLGNVIAPSFYWLHLDILSQKHTHYYIKGGRGSTKSSFVSIEIIMGMMKDENANAVILRKIGANLKDSVYEQLQWAILTLGVEKYWRSKINPLEMIYEPTGGKILFRGADDPNKIKSIKFRQGCCKYIWYEEVTEFKGVEEIRTINQSLLRGGKKFFVFYTYNPPQSQRNWVNKEVLEERVDKIVHHSTYLTVPREWLGEQIFLEAEQLKKIKPEAYKHEYLGEVTGTGGELFKNVKIRKITDEQITQFDKIARGVDWGYTIDPFVYVVNHYDKTRKRLYIFHEIYEINLLNQKAAKLIKEENQYNQLIVCDSAEPKSIAEMQSYGLHVIGAKKGADSIEYGIKWLQDLEEIIIDPQRCPHTAEEFLNYELERDRNGEWKAGFPDRNNHTIDAVRYSREREMRNVRVK